MTGARCGAQRTSRTLAHGVRPREHGELRSHHEATRSRSGIQPQNAFGGDCDAARMLGRGWDCRRPWEADREQVFDASAEALESTEVLQEAAEEEAVSVHEAGQEEVRKAPASSPTVPSPTAPTTPPSGVVPPPGLVAPPAPVPPTGPVAPPGPTVADLQPLQNAKGLGDGRPVQNLTVLDSSAPQQGSGTTTQVGGNGQPTDVWIFPTHMSYDWTSTLYDAGGMTYTETTHERERDNVLRYPNGTFALRFLGSSETCGPTANACTASAGGGA